MLFDLKTIYQAIYGFFDPWIRSYALRYMIYKYKKFDDIPSITQNLSEGVTYHFMHTSMQKYAFENLFIKA